MPFDGDRLLPKLVGKSAALVDVLTVRALGCRRLMRAPILLYRSGFGFLFGLRMLLVEHVGRRSGLRRFAVLEVLQRPSREVYVVSSGFGTGRRGVRDHRRRHPRLWCLYESAVTHTLDEPRLIAARAHTRLISPHAPAATGGLTDHVVEGDACASLNLDSHGLCRSSWIQSIALAAAGRHIRASASLITT